MNKVRLAARNPAATQAPSTYLDRMTTPASAGTALVTGASRGLGAVIARRLAADGHPVAVNYRAGTEAARELVADIRAAGGTAEAFAADVTEETAVTDLVRDVTARLGPVATLVVNATGRQPEQDPTEVTWETHLAQLTFFVNSPTLLMQAALPAMRQRGGGRIIQIGSDVLERALPEMSAYVAAKATQHSLTECWARALGGGYGITLNPPLPEGKGTIPPRRERRGLVARNR